MFYRDTSPAICSVMSTLFPKAHRSPHWVIQDRNGSQFQGSPHRRAMASSAGSSSVLNFNVELFHKWWGFVWENPKQYEKEEVSGVCFAMGPVVFSISAFDVLSDSKRYLKPRCCGSILSSSLSPASTNSLPPSSAENSRFRWQTIKRYRLLHAISVSYATTRLWEWCLKWSLNCSSPFQEKYVYAK